jgi:hypothetical protein
MKRSAESVKFLIFLTEFSVRKVNKSVIHFNPEVASLKTAGFSNKILT